MIKSKYMILALFVVSITGLQNSWAQGWKDESLSHPQRIQSLLSELTVEEKIGLLLDDSPGVPRLGIQSYNWWNEALHGVARNGRATVFPQAINLAATFDDSLIYQIADAISTEARAKFNESQKIGNRGRYAGLTFWSPNINIFRDLRWGRGQETYGEDPFLTGKIGAAFVRGMQGDHPQYLKSAAAMKHYAVHSGPEVGRSSFDARTNPKDLNETYLPAFKALLEAGVEGTMCSYNAINGVPACANSDFLIDTLRNSWGFDGYVVSDCSAIGNIYTYHGYVNSQEEAAAIALKNGVGINCGNNWKNHLHKAYEDGLVTEDDLDKTLLETLPTLFRLGLFDKETPWDDLGADDISTESHNLLALKAAEESIVLLKNNGVLPLSSNLKSIAVMGPVATSLEVLLGNYNGYNPDLVTFVEGISGTISSGTTLRQYYSIQVDEGEVIEDDWAYMQSRSSEATLAFIGFTPDFEGEGQEAFFTDGEPRVELPPHQVEFVRALGKDYQKPLIVIISGGSPRAIPEIHDIADAVIWTGYPGQAGGTALANILFGKTNPSGKLPVSIPYSTEDLPDFEDYSMDGRTYRFMDKQPLYPFGFGLSYTSFEIRNLELNRESVQPGEEVQVSLEVANTGQWDGEEIVQMYLKDEEASVRVPNAQLIDFRRVFIPKGTSKQLSFTIHPEQMRVIQEDGTPVFEEGDFTLIIGGASPGERALDLGSMKFVEQKFTLIKN